MEGYEIPKRWKLVEFESTLEPGMREFWFWHKGGVGGARQAAIRSKELKLEMLNRGKHKNNRIGMKDLKIFVEGTRVKKDNCHEAR